MRVHVVKPEYAWFVDEEVELAACQPQRAREAPSGKIKAKAFELGCSGLVSQCIGKHRAAP
jgi:hypothetical protein